MPNASHRWCRSRCLSPFSKSALLTVGVVFLGASLIPTSGWAQFEVSGFVDLRGRSVEAQTSYRESGFGRFEAGEGLGLDDEFGVGRLSLVGQFRSRNGWLLRGTVQGQASSTESAEQDLGLTELFVAKNWERERVGAGFRLGHFFLPTSRENVEPGWNSPFTMTFSAINSWVGEEVRPSGLELFGTVGADTGFGPALRAGFGAFGGNDSAGALLAWRGWVLSDRVVAIGEEVPLPNLVSLQPGGAFQEQRDDGTLPFGSDLDGNPGWYAFAVWRPFESLSVRATHYDNRGDKQLYRSGPGYEYAWSTHFDLIGADLRLGPVEFAAEWLEGKTAMGQITDVFVRANYEAYYFLTSVTAGGLRASLRYDDFSTLDTDLAPFDSNTGQGDAWTLAVFWEPRWWNSRLRIGAEWLDVDGVRIEAQRSGLSADTSGEQVQFGVRVRLGR